MTTMRNMAIPALILLAGILLWHCAAIRAGEADPVPVRIDLQDGLAGQAVTVRFGDAATLNHSVSSAVPLKGPAGTMTTTLPPGTYDLSVESAAGESLPALRASETVTVRADAPLYIGVRRTGEHLSVTIQETPFLYF